ncbi:hypothetical protein [Vibrio gallicus]|uniref:hypothetical protein n=1 Tax=Vibrio gallicus TaxID=190897 RepID=UPI0021C40A6B|nr:hypothetical protein [Vibrio gallicus]
MKQYSWFTYLLKGGITPVKHIPNDMSDDTDLLVVDLTDDINRVFQSRTLQSAPLI